MRRMGALTYGFVIERRGQGAVHRRGAVAAYLNGDNRGPLEMLQKTAFRISTLRSPNRVR